MPRLRVVDGFLLGESFDLRAGRHTIGRSPDNDIVIPDERVSRHHCYLVAEGQTALVRDMGSSNGTFVNGEPVDEARLFNGDEVRLGSHVLELYATDDASADGDVIIVGRHDDIKNTTIEIVVPDDTSSFVSHDIGEAHSPERLLRDLGVVYQVGNLINGIRNHDRLLRTVLDASFEAVEAAHGFLVIGEPGGKLVVKARRSQDGSPARALSVSRAIADIVMNQGQGVLINDALHDERFSTNDSIIVNHLRSVLCAPLKCQDKILGFIYLDNPAVSGAFSSDDLRLVSAIGIQAGVAIENSRLFRALEDLMFGSIGALVATVEAKDRYIKGHSERVARISRALGEELDVDEETAKTVHLAALLHDIGKIGISEAVLHKESSLDTAEREAVRQHAVRGAEILSNIRDMADVCMAVRHHHEFWDGSGYPDGIAGEIIPLPSRIITVADSYDAMTSDRPYRARLAQEGCLGEIVRCSGTQFDPAVVEAMLSSARKSRIISLS